MQSSVCCASPSDMSSVPHSVGEGIMQQFVILRTNFQGNLLDLFSRTKILMTKWIKSLSFQIESPQLRKRSMDCNFLQSTHNNYTNVMIHTAWLLIRYFPPVKKRQYF
jgi:hypothetical protein